MKTKIFTALLVVLSFYLSANAQVSFTENFDYTAGDLLTAHGWTGFSSTDYLLKVTSPGLTYAGYPLSGIGNAAKLTATGQDAYKNCSEIYSSGTVYMAFLVNVELAKTKGDYFLALLPQTSTSLFTPRVFVRKSAQNIAFGISKGAEDETYGTLDFVYGTTYLLVLKYEFLSGSKNDKVSLFVFNSPNMPLTEPATRYIGPITASTDDASSIGRIALRQGDQATSPDLFVDGIGAGKNWSNVIFQAPPPVPPAPVLSSPVNGAVSQPIDNLSLIWNASQNAVNYHLQVSLNSSFSSFVIEDASLTSTQKIISGLSYSTAYYWRVKAINSGGASPFSSVWSFTTVQYVPSAPLAPVLSSPVNGAVSQPIDNLSLIWNASQNAVNYHLQVSLNSSFSNFVIEDASLTNTSKIISGLSYSTTYYWRVKAINSGGASPFSSVWSFTTVQYVPSAPLAPVLSSPNNGAVSQPIENLSLIWNESQNAANYHLQVSLNPSFSSFVIEDASLTNTLKIISGLSYSTTYYWRVKAKNSGGESPFSSVWSFTTTDAPPNQWVQYNTGVPYSLFGVDFASYDANLGVAVGQGGTVIRTTNGGVNWIPVYSSINIWLNDVKFDPNAAGTVWAAGMGGVILKSIDGGINWSVARAYDTPDHTIRGIGIPDNYHNYVAFIGYAGTFFETTNAGNSFVQRTDIPFTMHSIAFSPDFSVNGKGIISGTDGKAWNTTNFGTNWVARNTNRYDYLNDVVYLDAVTAVICGNNGTILKSNNSGTNWTVITQTLTTQHFRSVDAFAAKVTICGDNGTILTSNDGGITFVNQLSGETRHLYGVSLKSSLEGTTVGEIGGSVSGMMYFTMRNGFTAVTGQGTELPDKFELKQNYPNPFNPSTTIMFDVLKQSKVSLRIYNVLGKEVAVLVDREMSAASGYKVKFDASALPSGVYFYRLQAGDFVDTKRMLLIK